MAVVSNEAVRRSPFFSEGKDIICLLGKRSYVVEVSGCYNQYSYINNGSGDNIGKELLVR